MLKKPSSLPPCSKRSSSCANESKTGPLTPSPSRPSPRCPKYRSTPASLSSPEKTEPENPPSSKPSPLTTASAPKAATEIFSSKPATVRDRSTDLRELCAFHSTYAPEGDSTFERKVYSAWRRRSTNGTKIQA